MLAGGVGAALTPDENSGTVAALEGPMFLHCYWIEATLMLDSQTR